MYFLPVSLPLYWTSLEISEGVIRIDAKTSDGIRLGFVTVHEKKRGYAFGNSNSGTEGQIYKGLGWRERMYGDAIQSLNWMTQVRS